MEEKDCLILSIRVSMKISRIILKFQLLLLKCQVTIVRKVKLILGVDIFLVGGKRCSQLDCVRPFMINKLPFSNTTDTVCFETLCLNANFRVAPKLNEAMAPFLF